MSEGIVNVSEREALAGSAMEFYQRGLKELDDHVLVKENEAKSAALVSLVLRKQLFLSGLPGGGKSTLAGSIHRLVEDIEPQNALWIPGQHDMTATQLVGGWITKDEYVEHYEADEERGTFADNPSHQRREVRKQHVNGVVHPKTQYIVWDELPRMNPYVVNAVNPILENRRLETNAGIVELNSLRGTVATGNPSESHEATFTVSKATKSRFGLGSVMGVNDSDPAKRKAFNQAVRAFDGDPADIEPVIDTATLDKLHDYAQRAVVEPAVGSLIVDLAVDTADAIRDYRVDETDRRIVNQIESVAKALGVLRKRNGAVGEADVTDATGMVIAARLGAQKMPEGKTAIDVAEDIYGKYGNRS